MKELTKNNKSIAIALGYFDCLHFAHRQIISEIVNTAAQSNQKSAVLTFSNELLSKGSLPVYTFKERKRLLSDLGADYVLPFLFDDKFKNLSKDDFLNMLLGDYDIKLIACGSDYRFGRGGEGDTAFLADFAAARGVELKVFDPIVMDGEVVSTTLVKRELLDGNIKKANRLLCDPYFFEGKVTRGKGRGQGLGYPTANIKPAGKFVPRFGVYKSRTMVSGGMYNSLTSVGNKPTFGDDSITVETYIHGDFYNLYNKTIRVQLIDFVRELGDFGSVAQLKAQIKKDIEGSL